ncbi:GcrA family cell cycle regulator [Rhizobium azibense]|uniref:GcrA cell cycle regulator n=1 Tax=Rhizobium azibense TaxID=1136135 RepID=A0A4R3RKC6_9HYPH|nr:GcrA family cell cycle regulator [Rhizobium azibense]TCU34072.1 GcrA cell cycle regulator [Rhizobium azibense]
MRHTWQTMNSDEKKKLLSELAAQGLSASQIAAEIGGTSRNAIIGFCHRKKIPLNGSRGGPGKSFDRRNNVVSIKIAKPRPAKPKLTNDPADVVALGLQVKPQEKSKSGPVNIFGLDYSTCRGPLNDNYRGVEPELMMFCGEVAEPDSSWCRDCQKKFTIKRTFLKKVVDEDGEPVKRQERKRKPFQRWLR